MDERRSVMLTKEPTEARQVTAKPRWPRLAVALAATLVVVGAVVVAWVLAAGGGPVAAGDAQIEVTFTGDGTSYDGDREIVEGDADITFVNDSDFLAWFVILRFDTGSAELAAELDLLTEGGSVFSDTALPFDPEFNQTFAVGTHSVEFTLEPGTYIFDTGMEFVAHVNRAAVIEVVAD
jgi:hypothetical protein